MAEWKELKIDNLPPDILTGGYEFMRKYNHKDTWSAYWPCDLSIIEIFKILYNENSNIGFKYRKLEPKVSTHEEIMKPNRYWRGLDEEFQMVWEKADMYRENDNKYLIHDDWRDRAYFSGRRFKDGIPPEEK